MKFQEQDNLDAKKNAKKVLPRLKVVKNTNEVSKALGARGFIGGLIPATARTCK